MLVLSRQRDEEFLIGDDIVITVVDIRGDKVRIGINAPKEIPVHRREVYDAIRRENERNRELDSKTPVQDSCPESSGSGNSIADRIG